MRNKVALVKAAFYAPAAPSENSGWKTRVHVSHAIPSGEVRPRRNTHNPDLWSAGPCGADSCLEVRSGPHRSSGETASSPAESRPPGVRGEGGGRFRCQLKEQRLQELHLSR